MTASQSDKAARFRALHEAPGVFVIPNGKSFTVAELAAAGVRRIRLATSLYRAAMSGLLDAAREVKDTGTFGYLDHSLSTPELNGYMQA
jgi:2-methylisocitrate lyase-like PEP mutase family enzyme